MRLQGVTTTGIYCRATCTARPRQENVRPMRNAVEAMSSGYRPCLLCRPDRLPEIGLGAPSVEVAFALRLIADGYLDDATTDALATRIGYSRRHLVRLFEEHVGASPDFVARARRAHLARRLLDESGASIASVAFASGFRSVRQMNRVMRRLFGFSPSELRKKRRAHDRLDPLDGGLRLRVPYPGPLAVPDVISYLGARAIPGVESVVDGRYRRTMRTCGFPGVVEVAPGDEQTLEVTMHLATFGSILDQVERVRGLFGLRRDGREAEAALAQDRLLGPLVRRRSGIRLAGAWDRFETAVRIIVGQQVSVAGATTVTGRLATRFGEAIDLPLPGPLCRIFPTPAALAEADDADFDMPRSRARTIRAFAAAVATGELDLARVDPLEETLARLQALPGIGPWTANLIAARVMNHGDAFPSSDLGLRRAAGAQLGRDAPLSTAELESLAESWRPFRATAAAYLWMSEEDTDDRT
ncbi:MAG: AlkA N-terminal domain-containing protein [Sandaracinaceae bacterium]